MSNKIPCSHCRLEFDKSLMIKEDEKYFCCNGCRGVFNLLNEEGLDAFYSKSSKVVLSPPPERYEDSLGFNSSAFYDKFVKKNKDNFNEVSLIIEGIHCSACVWLNEKALNKMDGIIEANINFTNNKATIIWVDELVKLSQIIDMIRLIGYNAFAYDASSGEVYANKQRKEYYLKMAVAIFASMNIMWIAVAQYAGYFSGITQDIKSILNIAEWILSTPVLFYSGWIFFRGAYFGLKNKIVNMDLLVATGASFTYIYSIYITLMQQGEAYFDSVSMIITFVLIGKFLEILSKKNASDTLDMFSKNIPNEVNVFYNNRVKSCKLSDVKIGDTIVISSGERILFDGVIIKGSGSFDESSLTGESNHIYKKIDDIVLGGVTSIDADIHFRVIKDFEHSTLCNLIDLLEDAIKKKPKIEQLANKLSEYFSSTILILSFLTFLVWWLWLDNFEISFMVAISVIVIACPCALALATPVATLVGLNLGIKKGILFKEAAMLETMAKIDTIVLDKTGTLTVGQHEVVNEVLYGDFDKTYIYSLVKYSNHPISKALKKYLETKYTYLQELNFDKYEQLSSMGIKATIDSDILLGGNLKLLEKNNIKTNFITKNTIFYFVLNGKVMAVYEFDDRLKESAIGIIKNLKDKNIDIVMLTGDNKQSADKIAKEVGIDNYLYEQSPQEKVDYISSLKKENKKVVMVGDGINDILALARADIGIVMGSGNDIAIEIGDVVLFSDSLKSLEDALNISKTTFNLIKQNLFISLVYNAITIPLAMAGYIIPLIAAISMSLSSLLVVGNSLRIGLKNKS